MNNKCDKGIIIAGHRGDPKNFPENTLESFKSAIDTGADMIETDIHATLDGELVLIHDHDVKRTTDGEGLVKDMTFEQIRALNAGDENRFMNVPTLSELLELAQNSDRLLLDLEIKVYLNDEGEDRVAYTVDKAVELCERYGISDERIMFNCFDAYVLEYIHKKYGKRFVLHGYYPFDILANIKSDPLSYLDFACHWLGGEEAKAACDYLISHGIAPCTGSSTSSERFFELAAYGCKMFTENDPGSALKFRNKL